MDRICCLRLNVLGILIGVFGAGLSFMSLFLLILGMKDLDHLTTATYEKINDPDILMENVRRGILVTVTLYITINILNITASLLLVFGTMQSQHLMLIPWLINAGISCILSALYFFNAAAFIFVPLITVLSAAVNLTIQILLWYVIYSLYNLLKKPYEYMERERKKNRQTKICDTPFAA